MTITWRELLRQAEDRLGSSIDARRIVERAAGDDVLVHLDEPATERGVGFFDLMVERRSTGEPLQYVVGRWGFRGLDLFVDKRVLIPRPETETVVEVALRELRTLGQRTPTIADLGTGSGAIALSIVSEVAGAAVWATDRSRDALAVARANLAGIAGRAATRVRLVEGSWFDALPPMLKGQFDLVVSNPPYVAEREVADLDPQVAQWEPRDALVAGPSGLEDIETIVEQAPPWLTRPGALVLEIAPSQAQAATRMAYAAGFNDAEVLPDLLGRARVVVARV